MGAPRYSLPCCCIPRIRVVRRPTNCQTTLGHGARLPLSARARSRIDSTRIAERAASAGVDRRDAARGVDGQPSRRRTGFARRSRAVQSFIETSDRLRPDPPRQLEGRARRVEHARRRRRRLTAPPCSAARPDYARSGSETMKGGDRARRCHISPLTPRVIVNARTDELPHRIRRARARSARPDEVPASCMRC